MTSALTQAKTTENHRLAVTTQGMTTPLTRFSRIRSDARLRTFDGYIPRTRVNLTSRSNRYPIPRSAFGEPRSVTGLTRYQIETILLVRALSMRRKRLIRKRINLHASLIQILFTLRHTKQEARRCRTLSIDMVTKRIWPLPCRHVTCTSNQCASLNLRVYYRCDREDKSTLWLTMSDSSTMVSRGNNLMLWLQISSV